MIKRTIMVLLVNSQSTICFLIRGNSYSTLSNLYASNVSMIPVEWEDHVNSLIFSEIINVKCLTQYDVFVFVFSSGTVVGFFKFSVYKLDEQFNIKEEIIKEILLYLGKLKLNFIDRTMLSIINNITNLDNFTMLFSCRPIGLVLDKNCSLQYISYYDIVSCIGIYIYSHGLFIPLINDDMKYSSGYIVNNYLYYWTSYIFYVEVINMFGNVIYTYHNIYVNNNIILLVKLIESDF